MSLKDTDQGQRMPRDAVVEMLAKTFMKLPDFDRKLFLYGPVYLGGNAGLAGLIANSFFRRALNVSQGRFTSSLPMAVLPFLTTVALYNATVSKPLLSGDLNCPTCALIRGSLVGVGGGGLYPILLALPVNAALATRYSSTPMPEKGNLLRFWTNLSKSIVRKMFPVLILQTVFGTYLSNKHYEIYLKTVKLSESDKEEYQD
ncbi:transmembrane protein 126A [Electrophorus electricus]|uniref:Transmembrane protein 126A n=1 Tax=Electrophorus electricus TaxID=8005 RepID=A0A4W4G5N0_ELEEL|nr:transmembrane protein 126A [Electrophorus electricus]XP_026868516.2 transmembrane protein 126A [Electrophorus electricus]